jgi:hypothetical protein
MTMWRNRGSLAETSHHCKTGRPRDPTIHDNFRAGHRTSRRPDAVVGLAEAVLVELGQVDLLVNVDGGVDGRCPG